MTFEETIAKSKELDRFLVATEGELKMSNIGGRFAGKLSGVMFSLEKAMEGVHQEIDEAATELHSEISKGKNAAKALRSEAAKVRASIAEIMGNATDGENIEGDGK